MLSDRGSLIVPVERALFDPLDEELSLGQVRFKRKVEHHMTVLNYGIGKHVKQAIAKHPELRAVIEKLAVEHPWNIRIGDVFHHVVQDSPGKPRLQTIVVMIDADISGFFERLRAQVSYPELVEALAFPPPPHVTLYTADPEGKAGIGLNRVSELEGALDKAADPEDTSPGLRAYRLHSSVVRKEPSHVTQ